MSAQITIYQNPINKAATLDLFMEDGDKVLDFTVPVGNGGDFPVHESRALTLQRKGNRRPARITGEERESMIREGERLLTQYIGVEVREGEIASPALIEAVLGRATEA